MLGEVLLAAGIGLFGGAVLRLVAPGLPSVVSACSAGLAGVVGLASIVAVMLSAGIFAWLPAVLAVVCVTVGSSVVVETRRDTLREGLQHLAVAIAAAGTTTAVISLAVSPILTFDSWRFLEHGASTFGDGAPHDVLLSAFSNYPVALVSLEGTAIALGMPFASSAVAAIGLLGVLGAVVLIHPDGNSRPSSIALTALIMALLMWSSYVLRLQLGYVNSHLLAAGLYSLAAASMLRTPVDPLTSDRGPLFAIACCGLALTRAEGLLVVALLLVAALGSSRPTARSLWRLWAVAIAIPMVWYGRLAIAGAAGDILTPTRMGLLLAIASGPIVVAAVPALRPFRPWLPVGAFAALSAALVALIAVNGATLATSTSAFVSNLFHTGGWGATWWIVLPLLAMCLARMPSTEGLASWSLVTVGFIAMMLALGGVREVPYRLGWGDSANRIMIHVLPVIGLAVIAAMAPSTTDDATRHAHGD